MKYFSFKKPVLVGAFLSWFVPLFVSFFLVDPNTKAYLIDFWFFKGLMMFLLGTLVTIAYMLYQKKEQLYISIPNTFVAVNILGDVLVLLLLFQMPLLTWLTTIFPVYPLVIYGLYFILKGKKL